MRELHLQINKKDKQIKELLVLIDTLQTNLKSAVSYLNDDEYSEVSRVGSFKWCIDWDIKNLD